MNRYNRNTVFLINWCFQKQNKRSCLLFWTNRTGMFWQSTEPAYMDWEIQSVHFESIFIGMNTRFSLHASALQTSLSLVGWSTWWMTLVRRQKPVAKLCFSCSLSTIAFRNWPKLRGHGLRRCALIAVNSWRDWVAAWWHTLIAHWNGTYARRWPLVSAFAFKWLRRTSCLYTDGRVECSRIMNNKLHFRGL